jgi:phage terminase large subunit-like protein
MLTTVRKTKTKTARQRSDPTFDFQWDSLLRLVPGYDPFTTAGDCTFDPEAGAKPIYFFADCLRHVKGEWAGKPIILKPWQQAIMANLFGWKRPDGTRRYREAFIEIPRKNSKTTMTAGVANFVFFCDGEPGAEIYTAAAERRQAGILFEIAKGMVLSDDVLKESCETYKHAMTINSIGATFRPISADANTKHGFNSHAVIVDELHAQPNRELVDVLRTSTGSRRQPIVMYLTMADYYRESICNETYDYACKVRDGVVDDQAFLPVIYEAKLEDDWKDPKIWAKANPNLGVSVYTDYVERECQKAQESPASENTFKRLQLNIQTEQDKKWLDIARWNECGKIPVDHAALAGRECVAGLDLSSLSDITAFVLLFTTPEGVIPVPYFWIPGANVEKKSRVDRVPYLSWINRGLIETTPGDVIDFDFIRKRINEISKQYHIREIAVDPWNAQQISTQLESDGFQMVKFPQGYAAMNEPTKELERLILARRFLHGGNPILKWMASNVTVDEDKGNVRPSRRNRTEKIDGIVCCIMALGRKIVGPIKKPSVYETRGLLRL